MEIKLGVISKVVKILPTTFAGNTLAIILIYNAKEY